MSKIKEFKREYFQKSLYCECGQKLDDVDNDIRIETKTLLTTKTLSNRWKTDDITGKSYLCPKCGKEHIEEGYQIYPIVYYRLVEI